MKYAYGWAWALTGILIFLFPLPLLGEEYIFNKMFFTFWVTIGFIWSLMSSFTTILYPVWESREGEVWLKALFRSVPINFLIVSGIAKVFLGIVRELCGNPPPKSYETLIELSPAVEKDHSVTFHDVSTADQKSKVDAV